MDYLVSKLKRDLKALDWKHGQRICDFNNRIMRPFTSSRAVNLLMSPLLNLEKGCQTHVQKLQKMGTTGCLVITLEI